MVNQPERATYSIVEAGKILGLSRNSAYEAARTGQLPTLRIGGKLLVPKVALDRLLSSVTAPAVPQAA